MTNRGFEVRRFARTLDHARNSLPFEIMSNTKKYRYGSAQDLATLSEAKLRELCDLGEIDLPQLCEALAEKQIGRLRDESMLALIAADAPENESFSDAVVRQAARYMTSGSQ